MFDFKKFYASKTGRVTRRTLKKYTHNFLDTKQDTQNKQEKAGIGFASPYIDNILTEENYIEEYADRLLVIHHLEYTDNITQTLKDFHNLLKPEGRMLIIVPNRSGFWAQNDTSPFGHGTPFNLSQIQHYLHEAQFDIIKSREALFMPPTHNKWIHKLAPIFERIGRLIPIAAGVHIIEAQKTIYAPTGLTTKDKPKKLQAKPLFPQPTS